MSNQATLSPILALARAGATSRAWDAFVGAGLDIVTDDPKVLTLKGRLLKDQARAAHGEARARLFLRSARAYAGASALRPDSYPLINAATMSLFAGQTDHMILLARQVLTLLQTGVGVGETPYWHEATRAEAHLLLGHTDNACAALSKAIAHTPQAWEDHATTLRQFRQILAIRGEPFAWLQEFAPPPSLYFGGIIGIAADDMQAKRAISDMVHSSGAGFGYGALAAGADILIAEALIEAGAQLHVILPSMPSAFKSHSVDCYGPEWSARFDALFEIASSVAVIDRARFPSHASVDVAARVAKGCAIDNAGRMESHAIEMRVSDLSHIEVEADLVLKLPRTAPADGKMETSRAIMLVAVENYKAAAHLQGADASTDHQGTHIGEFTDIAAAANSLKRLRAGLGKSAIAVNLVIADGEQAVDEVHYARVT